MPKLFGVNLVAVLVAALVMFFIGFVVYGLVFQQVWLAELVTFRGLAAPEEAAGLSTAELSERLAAVVPANAAGASMAFGFLISLVTAFGLALAMRFFAPATIGAALSRAVLLWFGFAATTLAYDPVYSSASAVTWAIDLAHTLTGYLAGTAVIFYMSLRPKPQA